MTKKSHFFLILTGFLLLIKPCFAHLSPEERLERVKGYLTHTANFNPHTQSKDVVEDFYGPDLAYVRAQYARAQNGEVLLDALDALDRSVREHMDKNHPGTLSFAEYNTIAYTWASFLSSNVILPNQEQVEQSTSHSSLARIVRYWNDYVTVTNWKGLYGTFYANFADPENITIPVVSETGCIPVPLFNRAWGFDLPDGRTSAAILLGVPTNPRVDFDYLRGESASAAWYHDYEHAGRSRLFDKRSLSSEDFMQSNSRFFAGLNRRITQVEDPVERGRLELAMFLTCHERQGPVHRDYFLEMVKLDKEIQDKYLRNGVGAEDGIRVSDEGFFSLNQYESTIEMARSLGLPISDFDEIEDHANRTLHQLAEVYEHASKGYEEFISFPESHYSEESEPSEEEEE